MLFLSKALAEDFLKLGGSTTDNLGFDFDLIF